MREFVNLYASDDWYYCMNILECVPNINISGAQKELAKLMGWNEEHGCFSDNEWDYIMLDKVLFKYIGKELYHEY